MNVPNAICTSFDETLRSKFNRIDNTLERAYRRSVTEKYHEQQSMTSFITKSS